MNPLIYIDDGSEDPRGNWKDDHFGPLKGRCFNIVRDFPWIFLTNIIAKNCFADFSAYKSIKIPSERNQRSN